MPDQSLKALHHALWLTIGLWIFSLFINSAFPLKGISIAGLLFSSYWMNNIHHQNQKACFHPELWTWRKSLFFVTLTSLAISLLTSIRYRISIDMPIIPGRIEAFALISILIGCFEELVFRGFVQGEASRWNARGAIIVGATSHAGYKALLFALSEQAIDISPQRLFVATFLAGLGIGFTRYRSGSLWPAILAHCFFDFWVYAEQSSAPWWVW
jgi:membrane protease YdiL (CAAX protease family)